MDWGDTAWQQCDTLSIDSFHPRSTDHHPVTEAKLLATPDALHVLFRVQDRYVKSISTAYQDPVCRDSCVELFWQPIAGKGYFNFEFNCGGVMLLYYIEDARRKNPADFEKYTLVAEGDGKQVETLTTLPPVIPVEITEPTEWFLAAKIPFSALEPYVGKIKLNRNSVSRANLYKCAGESSHPHWASWVDVGEPLNFHKPEKFGELVCV